MHGGRASRSPFYSPASPPASHLCCSTRCSGRDPRHVLKSIQPFVTWRVMSMHLRPLHDRIIVQRLEDSERTGAIVIPDSAKEKPQHGKVLAAGLGKATDDGPRQ